jgi:hypothetical protein
MAEREASCAKLRNVDVEDIGCNNWGWVTKIPNPGVRMCRSLLRDARMFTILWICCSVLAALTNAQKRKTKGMSALLNTNFGG